MNQSKTYRAILSKTTTDQIKSKVMSPELTQLVFDVYMTPSEYAELITTYFENEFKLEIKPEA